MRLWRSPQDGLVQGWTRRRPEGSAVSGAKLRSEGSPRRGKQANGQSRGTVSGLIRQRKSPVTIPSARAMNRVLLSKRL